MTKYQFGEIDKNTSGINFSKYLLFLKSESLNFFQFYLSMLNIQILNMLMYKFWQVWLWTHTHYNITAIMAVNKTINSKRFFGSLCFCVCVVKTLNRRPYLLQICYWFLHVFFNKYYLPDLVQAWTKHAGCWEYNNGTHRVPPWRRSRMCSIGEVYKINKI